MWVGKTPARYCFVHRNRLEPSPFRDSFETDFNEKRHGWRQDVAKDKFPAEEGGF